MPQKHLKFRLGGVAGLLEMVLGQLQAHKSYWNGACRPTELQPLAHISGVTPLP